ncbi:MAG: 23S rRNA (adenine(2503)-C(2))-methyltransferase RlmN [Candidatus Abyssobacteria bacterium SURF_5]|uniref:Probable dual-specificity RNA methyltransferase RlmN n=1 Tax=Abyssobacteria bacterium (strain SURF_5) TaxID=2093360 RepID=A0A3A4NTN2_ABYX5|nr:MAG: 23S rRNA (adenine(2503)-C(2))-methyltransferase RlmN [Candidatus Abyssubacteria bacterium SURF_5]
MSTVGQDRPDLLAMLPEEVDALFLDIGLPRYRSAQVVEWLYVHGARSFDEMTNLPKSLRETLSKDLTITNLQTLKVAVSRDRTKKFLFGLTDGAAIETVLLPEGERSTACISTQVGCAFGCLFCASGAGGLARNLTAGEIVDQARKAKFDADAGRLTNIVVMGMGEPLANYEATTKAVRIFLHERGLALGGRRITISTAGFVPGIRRLAADDLPVRVALSLHAADNRTRNKLMPINRKYPLEQVIDSCTELGRRRTPLTLEYMLIFEINDSFDDAARLADIAHALKAKVNLIPYNPVPGGRYRAPSEERVLRFQARLREAGVLAFIRRSRGTDIDAACGQLRQSASREGHG